MEIFLMKNKRMCHSRQCPNQGENHTLCRKLHASVNSPES